MENLIMKTDFARAKKSFTDGLSSYTQANCQCTITSDGLYRIYRPSNAKNASDGGTNNMWGGLVLKPMSVNSNSLIKGHRYVIMFEIKGQSSNSAGDVNWNNNVGWNGGGLTPQPSNVVINRVVDTNFKTDNWSTFSYAWTINDDVYKVCTSSYASYVQGNTYLSYDGFKFGFGYTSTGAMGTDLYLKNFRMYDITNQTINPIIQKFGIINPLNFVEKSSIPICITSSQEMIGSEIIEY